MLAKKYRLPIQDFFKKSGFRRQSDHFVIKSFTSSKNHLRAGVVIGRNVFKRATQRNKMKRIIFSFFENRKETLPPKDFLIIALPAAAKLGKTEILKDLEKKLTL